MYLLMPVLDCLEERCRYCFEAVILDTMLGLEANPEAMLASLPEKCTATLHGGECLLLPLDQLEFFLRAMWKRSGRSGIQTNAKLITEEHIEVFKSYNTHIGVSIDGPDSLSSPYRPSSRGVNEVIKKLRDQGVSVGILCVLGRHNASTFSKLGQLADWLLWLKGIGVSGGRFLFLLSTRRETDSLELTSEELSRALLFLYHALKAIKWDSSWTPFRDIRNCLTGKQQRAVCWLNRCDIWKTRSCAPIFPDGEIGICDKTFCRGLYLRPSGKELAIRYEIQEKTDCLGCKYWDHCGGGCPMEGEGGDWRNKTKYCKAIYDLFEEISSELGAPRERRREASPGAHHLDSGIEHGDRPHGDWGDHGDSG